MLYKDIYLFIWNIIDNIIWLRIVILKSLNKLNTNDIIGINNWLKDIKYTYYKNNYIPFYLIKFFIYNINQNKIILVKYFW